MGNDAIKFLINFIYNECLNNDRETKYAVRKSIFAFKKCSM